MGVVVVKYPEFCAGGSDSQGQPLPILQAVLFFSGFALSISLTLRGLVYLGIVVTPEKWKQEKCY